MKIVQTLFNYKWTCSIIFFQNAQWFQLGWRIGPKESKQLLKLLVVLMLHLLFLGKFNPKRCGLFGQLRRRGGVKVSLLQITFSGHSNFGTDSTNSVSYESWHLQLKFETSLRLLRLILWPQEVSEVTEVKMKKIWGEIPRIANFWLTEM